MLFVVRVLHRIFVYYLNVSFNRLITSVWEERAVFPAIDYSWFCCFFSKEFLLPRDAWEGMRYFTVALPGPSI